MKKNEKCYTNRELSWLQFNERVLNEAGNPRVPLAERMTFASIYQTNLDEFFMVRVGTLMMQMNAKEKVIENKTGMTSEEQVKEILARVCLLEKKKAKIYEQLMGELEPKGIRIINFNRLSNEEGRLLEQYFDAHIAPFLSPMVIGKQQPFPFLANKQLYAIVLLTSQKGKKKTGIVPCSNSVFKRLIEIPTRPGCFMLSEELILHFISKLYPKYTIREKSIMRVTRNADIDAHDLYDEDMDYRDMMEQLIKKRVRLDPVRVELSRKINDEAKQELIIPTFRQDLLRTADIAEEVARFFGYANIPTTLPHGASTMGKISFKQRVEDVAGEIAQFCGFSQAMTYSFESPKVFDKLKLAADAEERKTVVISNPLGEDFSIMRTLPLNGMLNSLATNYNRRNKDVKLYELAKVYVPVEGEDLPDERVQFTLGFYGDGDNLHCKLVVPMVQAALGADIEIDGIYEDEKVTVAIPEGCQNDQIVRVKGFGMPRLKSDARGDLFAHIAVEVPKKLSKRERELLEELAAEMGEDVNEEKRSPLQKLRDIFE